MKQLIKTLDHLSKHISIVISKQDPKLLFTYQIRDHLFSLEGLLRIHLKTKSLNKRDAKIAEINLLKLKNLEDLMGKISFQNETKMKDSNKDFIPNSQVIKILENHWNSTAMQVMADNLQSIKFKTRISKIKKMFKKECKRINLKSKYLNKFIENTTYNHESFELGFHEWRRAIRWLSIYMQIYRDYFSLVQCRKKKFSKEDKALHKSQENSPFSHFKKYDGKEVKINKTKFYKLSEAIYKTGQLKEVCEKEIFTKGKSNIRSSKACAQFYKNFMKSKIIKNLLV